MPLVPRALLVLVALAACTSAEDAAAPPARPGSDAEPTADAGPAPEPPTDGPAGAPFVTGHNPVLTVDLPDPDVLRVVDAAGHVSYLLSGTSDSGDFRAYVSTDLVHWTAQAGLFGSGAGLGPSLPLGGAHYCSLWAPAFTTLMDGRSFLTFTATRFADAQAQCPEAAEDTGVYVAESTSPFGPYVDPSPLDTAPGCETEQPFAPEWAEPSCFGGDCDRVARLDGQSFVDPKDGRAWLGYAWYTNTPPTTAWEEEHYGEHVSLVELEAGNLRHVRCDAAPPLHLADPHDQATLDALAGGCAGCDENLSTTRGRDGNPMLRDGHTWGVVEGPSFLRRGRFVYVFLSAGVWDSTAYSVYSAFGETMNDLALDAPARHVGRVAIPSQGQSFGHGSPVLGPDGRQTFFVHHRLTQQPCLDDDDCHREIWVSPLEFEDRGDGLGDAWPVPVRPAEHPQFRVQL